MKALRNSILCSFIVHFFLLSLTVGLIEEMSKHFNSLYGTHSNRFLFPFVSAIFDLLAIALFSYLYYRSLNKKIAQQNSYLAKRQNILFANIAHDLKTPLTSITGFSKALIEGIVELKEKEEALNIIYQKSIVANELLDLLFQYTKLNSSEYKLNKQEVDINYLLKESIANNYDLIDNFKIDLEVNIPEEPIIRLVDENEMKRVFSNLLINACKHNPDHTKLLISLVETEGRIYITFADDGISIPIKEKENLFQPFISENQNERNFQGSGLGLAIIKSVIDKHNFSIELLNGTEKYTKKFVITM